MISFRTSTRRAARPRLQRGLSSVELIVVLSIFGALSGVVLFNFSDFSSSVSLNNLSQDIALVVKRAQTEASSGRFTSATGGDTPSYGVLFQTNDPDSFIYFEDLGSASSKNKVFDASEERETIAIETDDRISGLCVSLGSDTSCGTVVNNLHITFTRPYLDATIVALPNYSTASNPPIAEARIRIVSAKGETKEIIVTPIGQVRVE